jgi:ribosomal 50S subunit-associated protein YjgA (DUF615 family)
MGTATDTLWRLNNEYRRRLSQARTYLNLLEQLVMVQDDTDTLRTLTALRYAVEQVEMMEQEARRWRHKYYYESPQTKRMVQTDDAVQHALAHFGRMRAQHEARLHDLEAMLAHMQRPDPALTRVPTGDLWNLARYAIDDLSGFEGYMQTLSIA